MYRCNECDEKFVEPNEEQTTYEMFYGIDGGHTPLTIYRCPYCNSEDISELEIVEVEEDEDEYSDVDR